jgi:hypothetical protein
VQPAIGFARPRSRAFYPQFRAVGQRFVIAQRALRAAEHSNGKVDRVSDAVGRQTCQVDLTSRSIDLANESVERGPGNVRRPNDAVDIQDSQLDPRREVIDREESMIDRLSGAVEGKNG